MNHYETLGVGQRATQAQIKDAFRALAREWHPDRHEGKPTRAFAEEKFKGISAAYTVLTDPHSKLVYDESLQRPVAARTHQRWTPRAASAPIDDLLNNLGVKFFGEQMLREMLEMVRRMEREQQQEDQRAARRRQRENPDAETTWRASSKEATAKAAPDFAEFMRQQAKKAGGKLP